MDCISGANFAAAVATESVAKGNRDFSLSCQVLFYPATNLHNPHTPSMEKYENAYILPKTGVLAFYDAYLNTIADAADHRLEYIYRLK